MLGLWLLNRRIAHPVVVYGYLAAEVLFLVAAAVAAHLLQGRNGVALLRGKRVELLPEDTNYTLLYATCLVVALIQVIGLVLGGSDDALRRAHRVAAGHGGVLHSETDVI